MSSGDFCYCAFSGDIFSDLILDFLFFMMICFLEILRKTLRKVSFPKTYSEIF